MRGSTSAWRRGLAAVLVAAGVGVASWAAADRSGPPPTLAAPAADSEAEQSPGARPEPVTTIRARAPRPDPAAGPPRRVRVPSLGIDAPVVDIPVADGILTPPADPQVLGWWDAGAAPGAVRGGALVTGHTVSVGGGALDDLETVDVGAPVQVRTAKGVIRYRVTQVDVYRKATLARNAQTVFSQTGPGRLVLITCEDYDGTKYLSNVVVYADPVRRA